MGSLGLDFSSFEGGVRLSSVRLCLPSFRPASKPPRDSSRSNVESAAAFRKTSGRLAALKASKKNDNLKVKVSGEIDGDAIKVASLKLQ